MGTKEPNRRDLIISDSAVLKHVYPKALAGQSPPREDVLQTIRTVLANELRRRGKL